jgi:hypothetical protein
MSPEPVAGLPGSDRSPGRLLLAIMIAVNNDRDSAVLLLEADRLRAARGVTAARQVKLTALIAVTAFLARRLP